MPKKQFLHWLRIWGIAVRPFAYTGSVSAVCLGLAFTLHAGHAVHWGWFLLTLLGVVCFHTAANLLSDVYDFRRGLDTVVFPTSGALVRGLLTEPQVFRGAMVFLAAGVALGLWLTAEAGWPVLGLGLAGGILAIFYTGQRFGFKYQGLGDLAVLAAFGPLPVFGTYWVQTRAYHWLPVAGSLPIALLTVGILHANNWRDIQNDLAQKSFTFASRLGAAGSAWYYRFLILSPYFLAAFYGAAEWFGFGSTPAQPAVLAVLLTLPLAFKLAGVRQSSERFLRLDGETAKLQSLFSLLLIAGLLIARRPLP